MANFEYLLSTFTLNHNGQYEPGSYTVKVPYKINSVENVERAKNELNEGTGRSHIIVNVTFLRKISLLEKLKKVFSDAE
jgi:hypothetical protein